MSNSEASSEDPKIRVAGWTVVSQAGDVETSSDDGAGSSSSSDFVDLGKKAVHYHHRDKSRTSSLSSSPKEPSPMEGEREDISDTLAPSSSNTSSTASLTFAPWLNGWFWDEHDTSTSLPDGGEESAEGVDGIASLGAEGGIVTASDEESIVEVESDTPSVEVISQSEVDLARSEIQTELLEDDQDEASLVTPVYDGIEDVEEVMEVTPVTMATPVIPVHPAVELNLSRKRHLSSSDSSESSDFVRLDAALVEELIHSGRDEMSASNHSGSSISDHFRFVHPMHGRPIPYREDDEESIPDGDVDDRCESDISGIAEDDSDLSCTHYGLADEPLTEGNVKRNARFRPNSSLNGLLTLLACLTLFLAIGIGIGHYIGSKREAWLRSEQVNKLRAIQDDYLMCLHEQERLEQEALDPIMERNKWEAITDIWKKKYEELLIEKVELEQQIKHIENKHQSSLVSVHEDLFGLQQDIEHLEKVQIQNEQEKQQLVEQLDELTASQQLLRIRHVRLEQEKYVVQNHLTKAEDEKKHLNSELTRIVNNNVDLHDSQERASQGLQYVQQKETQVRKQLLKVKEDMKLLTDQKQILQAEKSSLLQKVADFEGKLLIVMTERDSMIGSEVKEKEELKKQMNVLHTENVDLKAEVGKLRYSAHPSEMLEQHQQKENTLKVHVNQLANENADLKSTVGKMRYTENNRRSDELEPQGSQIIITEELNDDENLVELKSRLVEVNEELAREKARARLWETMFVADRVNQGEQRDERDIPVAPPSLSLCLTLLVPSVNMSELMERIGVNVPMETLTNKLHSHMTFLRNMTADMEFTDMLNRRWQQFTHYAEHPQVQNFVDEAVQVYHDMQNAMNEKWRKFKESEQVKVVSQQMDELKERVSDTVNTIKDNEKFRHVVDKTKESMAELSGKLADTWEKVKNLSNDFLDKHKSTIETVQETVTSTVNNLGDKVVSGVNKVHKKIKKKKVPTATLR